MQRFTGIGRRLPSLLTKEPLQIVPQKEIWPSSFLQKHKVAVRRKIAF